MVTIKDVARVAGVSTATVSRVVRGKGQVGDKCRAKVQKIIKEMAYRPNINARALVSRKSETIGVVVPSMSTPFFGSIVQGAEEVARNIKYKMMVANPLDDAEGERRAIDSLRESGCENIVFHSKYLEDEVLIRLSEEIPGLILINRFIPSIANRCVWLDNTSGGRMSAEYLLQKGHTDIAILTSYFNKNDPVDRINGVQQAMAKKGLSIPDEMIFVSEPQTVVKHGPNSGNLEGEATVQALLASGKKFTAIVAYNDHMAIGAMNALLDRGIKVPEDVSVVGYDNVYISTICRPQLTTMHYPIVEMAKYATELSLNLTKDDGEVENKTHLFMPSLIERLSVKSI